MEFSEACSEVDYILEHLYPDDKKKIPETVIEFFKENKAIFYQVNININQPLENQNLKDETKAFLQILNYKYFADEEQKKQFKEIFKENEKENNTTTMELTVYKENKIINWFKSIWENIKGKLKRKKI